MKKRILGILISVLLLFTALPAGAEFIDVHGTKYEEAVQLLSDLGVVKGVSDDFYMPNEPVKRGDAAILIARISGISLPEAKEIFTDVPKDHYASAAIALAYQMGIISGTSETTFSPDGFVTGEQMAKMLVTLAGYKVQAEAFGGYPSGYLTVANRQGILDGVNVTGNLTRGEVAKMLYNTLFVNPLERVGYGDDSGAYAASAKNILQQNLGIYVAEGIVEANAVTAVSGAATREGYIRMGSLTIKAPMTLSDKIGQKMTVYYKENEAEELETVSFCEADDTKTVRLSAEDIRPETSTSMLWYQRGEDEKAVSVSLTGTVVIVNGSVKSPFTAADLSPLQGTVIVTEKNDGASVIVVESYTDFVVDSVNTEEGKVYYKENASGVNSFDYQNVDTVYTILDADGKAFDITKAKKDMTVSVMQSEKYCKAIVSDRTVQGTVTEVTADSAFIDGKEILFSAQFEGMRPQLGAAVILALNFDGNAVCMREDTSLRKYGYLMTARYEGKGLSTSAKMKILTAENVIKVFEAAEKISVNGVVIGKDKLFNDAAADELTYAQGAAVYPIYWDGVTNEQLVVYEENTKGEITSIVSAKDGTESLERDPATFTLHAQADSGMFIGYGLRTFFSKYRVSENALVFSVAESYTGENDDQYKVMAGQAVQHSNHYPGLKLYDCSEVNDVSVMVTKLKMSDDTSMFSAKPVLVKEVLTLETEEGEICDGIRVVDVTGTEKVLYNPDEVKATFGYTAITDTEKDPLCVGGVAPDEIPTSKLRSGDIIKYYGVDDVLSSVLVCLRGEYAIEQERAYEGTVQKWPYATNDYYQNLWVYAEAMSVGDTSFRFMATNTSGTKMERIHTFGTAMILIYDMEKGTIKTGNKASLSKGDFFFASRQNSFEDLIVIYR